MKKGYDIHWSSTFDERLWRFIRDQCPECGGVQISYGKPGWPYCSDCDAQSKIAKELTKKVPNEGNSSA